MTAVAIFLVVNGLLDMQMGAKMESPSAFLIGVAGVILGICVLTGAIA
jgi:hypothetical protein